MSIQHITVQQDGRLDTVVAEAAEDLSRSRATKLVKEGAVWVDGEVATRPSATVRRGQRVEVRMPALVPDEAVPQDLPVAIVFEDEDIVVVDKAPGMVVHPSAGHDDGTLVNALLHHVDDLSGVGGVERPGIVHRLDRGTSGLLVVAKHDRAHRHLAAQFAEHSAGRTYLAICHGMPQATEGTITSHLARHAKVRARMASTDGSHGRLAITHWRVVGQARGVSLVQCQLETGRTHQIRVHLTERGLPLVGDPMYKQRRTRLSSWMQGRVPEGRTMLHAWRLTLTHPTTGERCTFEAAPPDDFQGFLDAAGLTLPA